MRSSRFRSISRGAQFEIEDRLDAECLGDDFGDALAVGHGCQLDEAGAVLEQLADLGRDGEREAGLPAATYACKRYHPVLVHDLDDAGDILSTADEAGALDRKVVPAAAPAGSQPVDEFAEAPFGVDDCGFDLHNLGGDGFAPGQATLVFRHGPESNHDVLERAVQGRQFGKRVSHPPILSGRRR